MRTISYYWLLPRTRKLSERWEECRRLYQNNIEFLFYRLLELGQDSEES